MVVIPLGLCSGYMKPQSLARGVSLSSSSPRLDTDSHQLRGGCACGSLTNEIHLKLPKVVDNVVTYKMPQAYKSKWVSTHTWYVSKSERKPCKTSSALGWRGEQERGRDRRGESCWSLYDGTTSVQGNLRWAVGEARGACKQARSR